MEHARGLTLLRGGARRGLQRRARVVERDEDVHQRRGERGGEMPRERRADGGERAARRGSPGARPGGRAQRGGPVAGGDPESRALRGRDEERLSQFPRLRRALVHVVRVHGDPLDSHLDAVLAFAGGRGPGLELREAHALAFHLHPLAHGRGLVSGPAQETFARVEHHADRALPLARSPHAAVRLPPGGFLP